MIQLWGVTDRGVVRKMNQDAYFISSGDPAMAIVCDGMGGAKAGNVASELAVTTAAEYLTELERGQLLANLDLHLNRVVTLANQAVHFRAYSDPDCWGMGTTMVAAVVMEDRARVLNVGDSRAYWISHREIRKVTRDHSLVEQLVLRGQITPQEARVHPQRNLITRALGSDTTVRADLYDQSLAVGEALLLCSDGLSNVLTDEEIRQEVTAGGPIDTCCQRLLSATLQRGAPDNVTVVLITRT